MANVRIQGQAGFAALNMDELGQLAAKMHSEKPRCPLVP
jgi:hypothetical protein